MGFFMSKYINLLFTKELEKVLREKKQAGAELRLVYERVDLLGGEKKIWDRHVCTR